MKDFSMDRPYLESVEYFHPFPSIELPEYWPIDKEQNQRLSVPAARLAIKCREFGQYLIEVDPRNSKQHRSYNTWIWTKDGMDDLRRTAMKIDIVIHEIAIIVTRAGFKSSDRECLKHEMRKIHARVVNLARELTNYRMACSIAA